MLSKDSLSQFRGELIEPGDSSYERARSVYNAMISRQPRLIARCADVADVIAALKFGHENGMQVAIRGGGHSAGGLGVCDDGLVIDLSLMRFVHIDPARRTVRVGGGAVWGDVDHATHAFGLAVPAGVIATTGVGGLTLGGGTGHLTRKYGLTIDNLLSADVVLADGRFVVANATENSDLFWALRGGGGNFGVVTSFLFQAHPVHTVCAGPMLWELEEAPEILKSYRDFLVNAPTDLNGFFAFLTVPPAPPFPDHLHMKKMCGIVWCHTGAPEAANRDVDPIRKHRKPAFEHFGPVPYPMMQGMFDPLYPPGLQWYWKGDFFNEISDASLPVHMKFARELPSMHSTMHLYPIDGAAHRPGNNDTAWSYRDAIWNGVIVGVDPDPASRDRLTSWARSYYEALHPFSAGGAYVNFMMEEGEDRIRATYRGNYERLARIKAKYDPENFFRVNHNIRPAMAA
jgi:FAD/FMN-containing dehydrogenase